MYPVTLTGTQANTLLASLLKRTSTNCQFMCSQAQNYGWLRLQHASRTDAESGQFCASAEYMQRS